MPMVNSNAYGLIIVSLGLLGVILSFLVADRRKYVISLALSGLIVGMGLFQYVSSGVRQWKTSRRIAKLQEQQRVNLEALQERLRQAQSKTGAASSGAPASKSK